VKYKSQSILSKVGYNKHRNISTTILSNKIDNSLDFNPFNPFNSFDTFEYDEQDPMSKVFDITHTHVSTIDEQIMNFNALYEENPNNPRLEMISNSILDMLDLKFGFKLGLSTDNNVKRLHYILNNALNIIMFVISAIANELIKQMVRNSNSIHSVKGNVDNKDDKINHVYKIIFNTLKDHNRSTKFANAFYNIISDNKESTRLAIIAKLKNKSMILPLFVENSINVLCTTLFSIFDLDKEELQQELLHIALNKVQKI